MNIKIGRIMKYWSQQQKVALKMLGLKEDATDNRIKLEISKKGHLTQRALFNTFRWDFPD